MCQQDKKNEYVNVQINLKFKTLDVYMSLTNDNFGTVIIHINKKKIDRNRDNYKYNH